MKANKFRLQRFLDKVPIEEGYPNSFDVRPCHNAVNNYTACDNVRRDYNDSTIRPYANRNTLIVDTDSVLAGANVGEQFSLSQGHGRWDPPARRECTDLSRLFGALLTRSLWHDRRPLWASVAVCFLWAAAIFVWGRWRPGSPRMAPDRLRLDAVRRGAGMLTIRILRKVLPGYNDRGNLRRRQASGLLPRGCRAQVQGRPVSEWKVKGATPFPQAHHQVSPTMSNRFKRIMPPRSTTFLALKVSGSTAATATKIPKGAHRSPPVASGNARSPDPRRGVITGMDPEDRGHATLIVEGYRDPCSPETSSCQDPASWAALCLAPTAWTPRLGPPCATGSVPTIQAPNGHRSPEYPSPWMKPASVPHDLWWSGALYNDGTRSTSSSPTTGSREPGPIRRRLLWLGMAEDPQNQAADARHWEADGRTRCSCPTCAGTSGRRTQKLNRDRRCWDDGGDCPISGMDLGGRRAGVSTILWQAGDKRYVRRIPTMKPSIPDRHTRQGPGRREPAQDRGCRAHANSMVAMSANHPGRP